MKRMCSPGYHHHNGFMATHALGRMMHGCVMCHGSLMTICGYM